MVQSRTTRDKALNTHMCKVLQNSTRFISLRNLQYKFFG